MTSSLNSGSPAPSINVQHWLRGDPLSNLQLGKIYILDFFSTGCGPCGPALARLAQLQEEYGDMGVEIIAVASREEAATADEARAQVDAWASKWLPNSNNRIAFDYSGEMDEHWMDASLSFGVPQAFVVDRDGSIAFIGDPDELKFILPRVIDGSWRASAEAKNAESERIAEGELDALEKALLRRIRAATEIEDWKTTLSAIEEGINLFPDSINFHQWHVGTLIEGMRDMDAGWIALGQFARDAIERNSEDWLSAVLEQLFGWYDYSGLPSAERFSMGKELSERILRLYQQQALSRADSSLSVALYYHESGDNGRAVDVLEQALKFVDGESLPEVEKEVWLLQLLHTLAEYKGEQVCHGKYCVPPPKQP
ncbi:TlpA disulfide reductase family protein [Rhizobium leguminosarum]|uniref:TlpA disulfide reductase family protein n=1 Tax=Rhizobium leguminosarum TaxID=384 RepID=UPI00103F94DB|nr:TlpA disulfide reductase family protein [Rhizobium leguminosarum]MBY5516253.1 TlpA family protein disulfide reductase [Rhizobium leguminosarum]NKK59973.1 redoxin family protein [Rhizobium leguminosarum bv. viciae]TBY24136.1 TlpA family protein disulfide reductase [Rhizobium leguminosarum bv. viciae]TBY34824.1 TlpA family protein disulfide reductase [Rhizobium leguminosarum bv. viciae]TBY90903.1 TlpA family protein disulfide reductase [Rhizobium leguminosarum bv. viciae]